MAFDEKQEQYGTEEGFSKATSAYEAPYVIRQTGSEDTIEQKPDAMNKVKEKSNSKSRSESRFNLNTIFAPNQGLFQNAKSEYDYSVFEDYFETHHSKQLSKAEKKAIARKNVAENKAAQKKFSEEQNQGLSQYIYQGLNQEFEPNTSESAEEQKGRRALFKPMLGIGFGLLLVALTCVLFTKLGTDTDYRYIGADALEVFIDAQNTTTYVFAGSGDMLYKFPEEFNTYYTSDHTSVILFSPSSRKCHVVNNKEDYEIFSPVLSLALSDDGKYVLYSVAGGRGKFFLYLYDLEKHSEMLLDKQNDCIYNNMYVSSGGNLCFYTTYPMNLDETTDEMSAYLIKDLGKPELIGKNQILTAYSDDQHILYLCSINKDGTAAYSKSADGITTVLSNKLTHAVFYNENYSELLLEENGSYQLWTATGECIPISDTLIIGTLIPSKVQNKNSYGLITAYGFTSFRNKVLITADNKLLAIDSMYQTRILGTAAGPQFTALSRDGSTLVYCNQEKQLVRVTGLEGDCKQTILEEQVETFRPLSDFRQIYYLKGDRLYYKQKNKEAVLISEQASDLCVNQAGDMVFFLKETNSGKAVYCSTDGNTPEPMDIGEQVTGLMEWNFGVVVQSVSDHETKAYYNISGSEFSYLIDGVTMIREDSTSFK